MIEILKNIYPNITNKQVELTNKYLNLVIEENKKYNLTSITDYDEMLLKHVYDSLLFTKELDISNKVIADVGTGAGFPGIILKIFYNDIELHLIEANTKKVNFLNYVINSLELDKCFVHNIRVEDYAKLNKEKFDIVVSRAVASLNILFELCSQLVKIEGLFIPLKGKKFQSEIQELGNGYKTLGFKLVDIKIEEHKVLGTRANIFYEKIKTTSNTFPRSYAIIKKKPLN